MGTFCSSKNSGTRQIQCSLPEQRLQSSKSTVGLREIKAPNIPTESDIAASIIAPPPVSYTHLTLPTKA